MAPEDRPIPADGPCPDDEALAAFAEGGLAGAERAAAEAHVAACDACGSIVADVARVLAAADAAPARPARRPRARALAWAAAAALLLAAGAAVVFAPDRDGGGRGVPGEPVAAAPQEPDAVLVSEVSGGLEVQAPGSEEWRPLAPGSRIAPGTALRSVDPEPTSLVLEGNLTLAFRREVEATLRPGPGALGVSLRRGGLAASPAPGARAIEIEVPEGRVLAAAAPLEVHVKRRGTLVIARSDEGVTCATESGEVRLGAFEHTILHEGRPPRAPRRFPLKPGEGPGWRKHRRHGDGPPRCAPPGGPELDELFKNGDGPT